MGRGRTRRRLRSKAFLVPANPVHKASAEDVNRLFCFEPTEISFLAVGSEANPEFMPGRDNSRRKFLRHNRLAFNERHEPGKNQKYADNADHRRP